MKKGISITLFIVLCFSLHAQIDNSFHKKWTIGVGLLSGINSVQIRYPHLDQNFALAMSVEGNIQYHFNGKLSVVLGLRLGQKNTNCLFAHDMTAYLLVRQLATEIPLLLGYRWNNSRQKEIITINGGALVGKTLKDNKNSHFVFERYGAYNDYINSGVYNSSNPFYYSAIIRLSKHVPISPNMGIQFFYEYDWQISQNEIIISTFFPSDNSEYKESYKIRNKTQYIGAALIF